MNSTVSTDIWKKRIQAARNRRMNYEPNWIKYAQLFTNLYMTKQQPNDDDTVILPEGDQVKVGIVYRNIEQTMAILELPELGVRATETDYTRELTEDDTHREAVVEQGLHLSLLNSGIVTEAEEADYVKRDGLIIGHGINYSQWRIVEDEIETEAIPVMQESEDGLEPAFDEETGEQEFEKQLEKTISWEGVEDVHISPNKFLFSSGATKIHKSPWHGYEDVIELDELKQNPQYDIPEFIKGTAFIAQDLYGDKKDSEYKIDDGVRIITIYDKVNRELLVFIEATGKNEAKTEDLKEEKKEKSGGWFSRNKPQPSAKPQNNKAPNDKALYLIYSIKYPVKFSHPDASPFSFFIPSPANDHPMGISQIEHIRNQAVEVDKLRTRAANLTRMLKTILFYQKGKVDEDQLKQAMASPEANPVGIDIQEEDDWNKMFKEIDFGKLHPEIYQQIHQGMEDVNQTTGIAEQPFTGADTATESDNQMSIAGARPKRKQRLYLKFLTEVARRHKDFLAAFAPDGQVIHFTAEDGTPVIQAYGRQAFHGKFNIEILPGGGATNISPVKQKIMAETFSLIKGQYGPQVDLMLFRQILTMTDARDINGIMKAAQKAAGLIFPPAVPGQNGEPGIEVNPNDISNGQALREAINLHNEGGLSQ